MGIVTWGLSAPVLIPIAATCLAVTMVGASVAHARRREPAAVAVPAGLGALPVAVAVRRFGQLS